MKTSPSISFVLALVLSLAFMPSFSSAQIREVPAPVKDSFAKRYPKADSVEFQDNLLNVHVHFLQAGDRLHAIFTNRGEWKQTEKEWDYSKLSPEVQDGFQKSKYAAEWKVKETAIIYLPDGSQEYRLRISRNDLQKKYLFFNKNGRLLRDSLTI